MRITPARKIAAATGAGSLLLGAVLIAPGVAAVLAGPADPTFVVAPAAAERVAFAGPMAAVPVAGEVGSR